MKKLEIITILLLILSLLLQLVIFLKVFSSAKNLSNINNNLSRLELVD